MSGLVDTEHFQIYCLTTFMRKLGWRCVQANNCKFYKEGENPLSFNTAVMMYNKVPSLSSGSNHYVGWTRYATRWFTKYCDDVQLLAHVDKYNYAHNTKQVKRLYLKYSKRNKQIVCERHRLKFVNGYSIEDVEMV